MTPEEYINLVAERLRASGATVSSQQIKGTPVLVGYRGQFKLRWMATKLNLFTVVVAQPTVSVAGLEQFSKDALDYATAQKGTFRGLQNGVAAIPVMVAQTVPQDAAAYANTKLVRRFSAFAWPAAVDLTTGQTYRHQGRVAVGGIYAGWMRQQTAIALPEPQPTA